jgi:SAM-dependent methyltransferase
VASTPAKSKTSKATKPAKKAANRKKAITRPSKYTASTADKHELYQLSVQDPEFEVAFISRLFQRLRDRKALSMREDFCGTALFCAEWAKSHKERTATGVDLDSKVLAWGRKHNLAGLGEAESRIQLLQRNVLDDIPGKFDICVAFNFSYWCFKERATLLSYFSKVRSSLVKDGIFLLDAYGGYESHEPDLEEPRKIAGGFTYVWNQDKVDPINNRVVNHIHFEFKDKTQMRKAFSYDWRMWSLLELRELLEEAGFKRVTVYWEDADDAGEGTGVYRPRKAVVNEAGWIAYLLAEM